MTALLTYCIVYVVESALSVDRGRLLGTLFSHAAMGAGLSSLLVCLYELLLTYTYSSCQVDSSKDNKSIKLLGHFAQLSLLATYYAVVFGIVPLALSITLGIRCLDLPESPRWLLAYRTPRECEESLEKLRGTKEVTLEFNVMYRLVSYRYSGLY